MEIKEGAVLFLARHYADHIKEVVVTKVEKVPAVADIAISYVVKNSNGVTGRDFLGDMGVPGYAYDDRPNQVFTTLEEAEAGHILAKNWWRNGRDYFGMDI